MTDYLWYEIDITEAAESARANKESKVTIEVTEYFKRRRAPYPRRITIKDKQNLELYDSKYFLSPYSIRKQTVTYMLEKHRIVSYEEADGFKVVEQGIKYGPFMEV